MINATVLKMLTAFLSNLDCEINVETLYCIIRTSIILRSDVWAKN